eukprot:NODE_107_length_18988_cov_0.534491.p8 type:complete len:261 gc:universal NODE_107_length_18988_cov_0.534491:4343-3561(-)
MSLHNRARAISISATDHVRRFSEVTQSFSESYGRSLEYSQMQMLKTQSFPISATASEESSIESGDLLLPNPVEVVDQDGTSKYQTIFNTVNILMGISILALPYALYLSGWIFGIGLFILYSLLTNYTGKLLGKCMSNSNLKTYSDVAYAALGKYGKIVSVMFILELVAAGVALLILIEDSMSVFISLDGKVTKFVAFLIVTPFLWSNSVKILSYTSLMGIATFVYLSVLLIAEGLTVKVQPGSLVNPMQTRFLPLGFWSF